MRSGIGRGFRWCLLGAVAAACAVPGYDIDRSLDGRPSGAAAGSSGNASNGGTSVNGGTSQGSGGSVGKAGSGVVGASGPGGAQAEAGSSGGESPSCTTPPKLDVCGDSCVNLQDDFAHCGDCKTVCPSLGSCVKGLCTCPANMADCDTVCVPINDDAHCGSCTKKCTGAEVCTGGDCAICGTGCAVLSATFATDGQQQGARYKLPLGSLQNLNGAKVTARVHVEAGIHSYVCLEAYDANGVLGASGIDVALKEGAAWATASMDLAPSGWEQTSSIYLYISSYDGLSPRAATKIYVDWLDVGGLMSWDFDATASPLAYDASKSNATGSVTWLKQ